MKLMSNGERQRAKTSRERGHGSATTRDALGRTWTQTDDAVRGARLVAFRSDPITRLLGRLGSTQPCGANRASLLELLFTTAGTQTEIIRESLYPSLHDRATPNRVLGTEVFRTKPVIAGATFYHRELIASVVTSRFMTFWGDDNRFRFTHAVCPFHSGHSDLLPHVSNKYTIQAPIVVHLRALQSTHRERHGI